MNSINLHKEYCGQKMSISKTRHHFREDCSPLLPEKTTDHQQKRLISHILLHNYMKISKHAIFEKNTYIVLLHACPFVSVIAGVCFFFLIVISRYS